MTFRDAAAAAGIHERTLRRWYKEDPGFKATVEELRAEAVALAVAKLSGSMAGAADTLTRLLGSRSEVVRLRASKAILDAALKVREREELERRLKDLEEKLLAGGPGR
jgi:hypothetical protein